MNLVVLIVILLTVTLSACAQLLLKLAVSKPSIAAALQAGFLKALTEAIFSPLLWGGLIIYVFSVCIWLWVLSKVDLSVAYPFVGISFLTTMGFGIFFLNENVTVTRIIGTLLIALGCVFVGKSA